MLVTKHLLEFLPNIHMLGMLTMLYTVVYRKKALIPVYVFIFLEGALSGFAMWWVPYLYLWAILWGVTMLLPKNMPSKIAAPVYMVVCGLHGLCYGILYAPFQALWMGYSFKMTLAWIAAGFPFDVMHAIGNVAFGSMILPLSRLLRRLENGPSPG